MGDERGVGRRIGVTLGPVAGVGHLDDPMDSIAVADPVVDHGADDELRGRQARHDDVGGSQRRCHRARGHDDGSKPEGRRCQREHGETHGEHDDEGAEGVHTQASQPTTGRHRLEHTGAPGRADLPDQAMNLEPGRQIWRRDRHGQTKRGEATIARPQHVGQGHIQQSAAIARL